MRLGKLMKNNFEKKLQSELDKLPYEKHLDDGMYNDGQVAGFEIGARWAFESFSALRWVAFDWMKIETRPTEHGKYLICRKDGKIHWETWNGSGWAYNHNEVRFWAVITKPIEI
jgi:hypothetical protein